MNEITENVIYPVNEEDTTEALIAEYEDRKSRRTDDVIAMQTAVCMMAALMLMVLKLFSPEPAKELLDEFRRCTTDTTFVVNNPVDTLISYLQSR